MRKRQDRTYPYIYAGYDPDDDLPHGRWVPDHRGILRWHPATTTVKDARRSKPKRPSKLVVGGGGGGWGGRGRLQHLRAHRGDDKIVVVGPTRRAIALQQVRRPTMSDHLFPLASDAFKVTSDDCYTPRWVFDAMGLTFDLDVAAPPGGPWHVPAARYYTAEDDGLTSPWDGLVWCNPPYSRMKDWARIGWRTRPAS